jgi:hypothetical protein
MVVETAGIPSSFNWASVDVPEYGLNAQKALSEPQKEQVRQLKALDKQVRAHEQEHLRVGGALVRSGGALYEYNIGPDGRLYAARGGVEVDNAPVKGDPQATADKARKLKATALAAGLDASSRDRQVAAGAEHTERNAYAELEQRTGSQTRLYFVRQAYQAGSHQPPATVRVRT